ncbi:MAG: pentapeptide repeat-containing protein [Coleofasciculaceae cyanobacterium]
MKAHEVLKRYADGRRDFSGENLRGQSFKGKNLSGANFSEADIRGANFTNAMLTGANFKGAKAGLQRRWATGLVIGLWVLSGLSGIYALLLGVLLSESSNSFQLIIISCFALIVFAVSWLVNIRKGLVLGLKPFTIVGALARAVALSFAFAFAATFAGAFIFAVVGAFAGAVTRTPTVGVAAAITGTVTVISSYIGWRTLTGDEEHSGFREFAIAFAAIGGTSFRNADLTDADFTSATLKSTDFRRANLTRTYWHQAKMLDRARPGTTYLQLPKVQQLLMTGQGQAQNFDRQPLRGVNLQGANLADASFIGTDLNEANLQDADLSRAKLVQTQLDETDLTGATLTGAYIEDWGITSHTKLDGVRCEYVFMRLPTKEDPEPRRKPDNRNETFKDGDFADFIKPIVDTLDLYHNQDVDPRAIAISFKQLAENHPESELDIVGMEKRGGDKFMLRVATAPDANHSELNAEYFTTYDEINALAKQEIKSLLDEKDSLISRLENMVATVLQRPSFYTSNYHGDINMSESKGNINITSGEGSKISGIAGAGENMTNTGSTIGEINGTVSIAINQLPASSESGKPGLKELLVQLQTAINDPNLAEDDKTQALEQIKVLAEAGQNPKNETTQKQAKKAIGFLKVIAEGLPSAASLVKTCQDLLPAIALYFGF